MPQPLQRHRQERRWKSYRNVADESVPAFGVVDIGQARQSSLGHVLFDGNKPRQGNAIRAANGPTSVGVDGVGIFTTDWPTFVRIEDAAEEPEFGDNWGVADGSFVLQEKNDGLALFGFQCLGFTIDNGGVRRTLVEPLQPMILKAKTNEKITAGSSGIVSIWQNGKDTERDVEAFLDWMHRNEDISSDKEILVRWFADQDDGKGQWGIPNAECE